MTELEKIQRVKMYLDKLADGIDPITDTAFPNDSVLNNVRLSRCFFYVSDILRQVINNGGTIKPAKRPKRVEFALTANARNAFSYSKEPLRISEFVACINEKIDTESMKKLTTTAITGWLYSKGFLAEEEYSNGRKSRRPTKQGEHIGLSYELRQGQYGDYNLVFYNEAAQRFIMDNLDEILIYYKNRV